MEGIVAAATSVVVDSRAALRAVEIHHRFHRVISSVTGQGCDSPAP